MTRIAWINCSAGVAGDMLLGALVDAGADEDTVAAAVAAVGVDGYALSFERVQRGGVAATWANVAIDDDHHQHHDDASRHGHEHRPVGVIMDLLDGAALDESILARARRVFTVLAEAEGAVHGITPADVELHEVGALDAIVDVVGVAAALRSLEVERIVCSPIAMGHGTVESTHGVLPNPPPAVVEMLSARRVPVVGVDTAMELATPTGVAVAVALAEHFGALPAMAVDAVGYGAGRADPPGRPNVVQVVVGDASPEEVAPRPGRAAVELQVNVDDVTGEVLAHTIAALVAAGAHDAWAAPIVMKKGRPAHTVHVLADPADVERLAAALLTETGSLGLRATTVERWPQRRDEVIVDVDGHLVRVKVGGSATSRRAKPEHDDAARAADALGRPLRDVLRDAETRALADRDRS